MDANPDLSCTQHAKLKCQDGLWFLDNRLIIPNAGQLQETLFRLAHDNLGHFGFNKSYEALRHSYFWPRMCKELETAYIPSCIECQRNKSTTTKPLSPLHPLPVPNLTPSDSIPILFFMVLIFVGRGGCNPGDY
jgi:Integrase zinc binding domain